ncbi:MAG: hypothetical protein HKP42_05305 [Maribacter sp.]|nr:hypothetical protein [Maribacter sp.]
MKPNGSALPAMPKAGKPVGRYDRIADDVCEAAYELARWQTGFFHQDPSHSINLRISV